MAESLVQAAPDSTGKKLHAWDTLIGGNTVLDEFTIPGEYPYPTYTVLGSSISLAVANDHLLCLNAPAGSKVRIRRVWVEQVSNATAVAVSNIVLLRTGTGAPTGGTAVTPGAMDTVDTAGSTGRTLPAVKGTEGTELMRSTLIWRQALSATQAQIDDGWEWRQSPFGKPIVIPAGVVNGLVLKSLTAIAGATVNVGMEFVETAF